ncbi:MAG TPA: SDR family NAD(P)-dependent oxidoreductase [Terriglobales bacterium]|nr:SDR family NAD(P)-dependent oxidoreductase [Terriglobales bacterium]
MRNILVTGASGGLGAAVVAALEQQGERVVGASHPEYDLTQPAEAARAVAAVGGRLHGLVHLMGGFAGGKPVAETDDATWRRMMTMNLDAAFYVARAAVPALTRQPGGRIVMIGSRTAVAPVAGLAAYNASKAGLVALVQTVAQEVAPARATANIILPSVIDTPANRAAMPQADPGKWVSPQSIAALIEWLLSPQAGDVNGAVIPIYGQA